MNLMPKYHEVVKSETEDVDMGDGGESEEESE
jgi:hypothetical protein